MSQSVSESTNQTINQINQSVNQPTIDGIFRRKFFSTKQRYHTELSDHVSCFLFVIVMDKLMGIARE